MSNITLHTAIVLRSDTAAQWELVNPVLRAGEPGAETDTGRLKLGNGTAPWSSLAYVQGVTARVGTGAPTGTAAAGALWLDAASGGAYLNCAGSADSWQRLVLAPELSALGGGDMQKNAFATNAKAAQGYVDKAVLADALSSPLTTAQVAESGCLYFTAERAHASFDACFPEKTVRQLSGGAGVLTADEGFVLCGGGSGT